jgi:hypothetical protein
MQVLARRGLLGRQPVFKPGRRIIQGRLQRALTADVPFLPALVANGVRQVAGQNLPQPSGLLFPGLSSKLA